jgi:uncharacterized membrane protein YgdD (TMEM256/DUF423 family)
VFGIHPLRTGAERSTVRSVRDTSHSSNLVERPVILAGATLGGLAVALGAFGAHALKQRIGADALEWWQTAVQYQIWHALAVTALGLSGLTWARLPAWLMTVGTVVFSGTLYVMALGAPHWLGAVTPLGGLAMICGWALLAWRAGRCRS